VGVTPRNNSPATEVTYEFFIKISAMAQDIAADQRAFHSTSKTTTNAIKTSSIFGALMRWRVPRGETRRPSQGQSQSQSSPAIPSAVIFDSLFQQQRDNTDDADSVKQSIRLPTTAQCAVHLEFIATLWVLRQRVMRSEELDEVFDIKPEHKYVDRKGVRTKLKDDTLWKRRQVKWDKFVSIAVVRFLAWWAKVPEIVGVREGVLSYEITNDTVPPLGAYYIF
jgi:hypothetical protein